MEGDVCQVTLSFHLERFPLHLPTRSNGRIVRRLKARCLSSYPTSTTKKPKLSFQQEATSLQVIQKCHQQLVFLLTSFSKTTAAISSIGVSLLRILLLKQDITRTHYSSEDDIGLSPLLALSRRRTPDPTFLSLSSAYACKLGLLHCFGPSCRRRGLGVGKKPSWGPTISISSLLHYHLVRQ